MSKTWIVVCDRVSARVFNRDPFHLLHQMENSLGRERNRALSTDRPGMSRAKFGRPSSLHSLTGEKDPHEDAAVVFGKKICEYLGQQKVSKKFDDLIIVAEPRMMGRIRIPMSKAVKSQVTWVAKDLGRIKNQHIAKALGLPPAGRRAGMK